MPERKPAEAVDSEDLLSDPPSDPRVTFEEFEHETLPEWAIVRQRFDPSEIDDVDAAVRSALEPFMSMVRPGMRVCLGVGSRGIDRIDLVTRAAVRRFEDAGAEVFIVPAMGSHGGATSQGQLDVLAEYGVTPEAMGCEIRSSMETVALGDARPGLPVWMDRNAFEGADLIIPINRVKVHTDFKGPTESGLIKMIAIGLGKQKGADAYHAQGFASFAELLPAVAAFTLAHAPIPFGLALLENGNARLFHIEAVPADRIAVRERELLTMATARLARIPIPEIDVLIVDRLGKDVSGLGMDSNIVGRYYAGPTGIAPLVQRIVVRDLTDETAGNAVGIGMADVALRSAVEKMDRHKTYMNCITAKTPEGARVPLTVECDREAVDIALACCLKVSADTARVVRILDTKHLELLFVSASLLSDVLAAGACELVAPLHPIVFDAEGNFGEDFPR